MDYCFAHCQIMTSILLDHGAVIAVAGWKENTTLLHSAAKHGHAQIMEILLAHGAAMGSLPTSLDMACAVANLEVAQVFRKRGLFPEGPRLSIYIDQAASGGHNEVVALLEAGKGERYSIR